MNNIYTDTLMGLIMIDIPYACKYWPLSNINLSSKEKITKIDQYSFPYKKDLFGYKAIFI